MNFIRSAPVDDGTCLPIKCYLSCFYLNYVHYLVSPILLVTAFSIHQELFVFVPSVDFKFNLVMDGDGRFRKINVLYRRAGTSLGFWNACSSRTPYIHSLFFRIYKSYLITLIFCVLFGFCRRGNFSKFH